MPTLRQRFRAASSVLTSVADAWRAGTTFGASAYDEGERPSRDEPAAVPSDPRWVDILEASVEGGDHRFLAAVDRVARQWGSEYAPTLLERNWERLTAYDIAALDKKSPRKCDEIWHSMEGHATGRAVKGELRAITQGKGLQWKPLDNESPEEARDRLFCEQMWKGQGGDARRRPLQQAIEHHLREYHRGGSLAEVEMPTRPDSDGYDRISAIRLVRRSRFDMYEDELGYPLRIRGEMVTADGRVENAEIGRDDPRWRKFLFGTFPDIETTGRFLGEPANYGAWPYWVSLAHHEQQERFTTERYANVFPEARWKGKSGASGYKNGKAEMLTTLAKARRGWGMVTPGDWEIFFHSPNVSGPQDLLAAAKAWSERQWRVNTIFVVNTSGTMVTEGTLGSNQAIIEGVRDKLRDELRERVLATVIQLSVRALQANFYGRARPSRLPVPEFVDDNAPKRDAERTDTIELVNANIMTVMEARRKMGIDEVDADEAAAMQEEQELLVGSGLMADPSQLAGGGVTIIPDEEGQGGGAPAGDEKKLPPGITIEKVIGILAQLRRGEITPASAFSILTEMAGYSPEAAQASIEAELRAQSAAPPAVEKSGVDTAKVREILAELDDPAATETTPARARELLLLEGVPEDRIERLIGGGVVAATKPTTIPEWVHQVASRLPHALERLDGLVMREGFDPSQQLPVMRQLRLAFTHGAPAIQASARMSAIQRIHDHLQASLELDLPGATDEQERCDVLERAVGELSDPDVLWRVLS